jgi:hypothetical protein
VLLDVPVVKVEEITLEVEDLQARVSLQAQVLDLLKLHVGADVSLGRVSLGIKGVEASALLKVRLDNVAAILDRVMTTLDENPQILEGLTQGVGQAVGEVGRGSGRALERVGEGAGGAVERVGEGAGGAVERVGEGTGSAAESVGEGAESVAGKAGEAAGELGRATGRGVEGIADDAGDAVEDVGGAVEDGRGDRTESSNRRASKGPGRPAGKAAPRRQPARPGQRPSARERPAAEPAEDNTRPVRPRRGVQPGRRG